MEAKLRKEQIFERKADNQGRISLPTNKYKGKKLEIAVLDELKD